MATINLTLADIEAKAAEAIAARKAGEHDKAWELWREVSKLQLDWQRHH